MRGNQWPEWKLYEFLVRTEVDGMKPSAAAVRLGMGASTGWRFSVDYRYKGSESAIRFRQMVHEYWDRMGIRYVAA